MKNIIYIIIFIIPVLLFAQDQKDYIRKGNKYYKKKEFNEAEINYRKSLELDRNSYKGVFNLGDALYKQDQYEDAAEHFLELSSKDLDKETKAKAYHNLGNSFFKAQKYPESINAYKHALRNNPKDEDTRYNLEYAKRMMAQQQQQQQKQDKNKDQDKKDKNKKDQNKQDQNKQDQNKQDQKKKDQQQQDQQKQNQDKKKQQQQQAKKEENKISKEQAKRMLQQLSRDERKLQKKLKKQKASSRKIEKNW